MSIHKLSMMMVMCSWWQQKNSKEGVGDWGCLLAKNESTAETCTCGSEFICPSDYLKLF